MIQSCVHCGARSYVPGHAEVEGAILHLVYEYGNLVHSGLRVQRQRGGPLSVHVGDVFLLNCRKMADFFSKPASELPDLRVADFCKGHQAPAFSLPKSREWRRAIDKQLAHISYDRVNKSKPIYYARSPVPAQLLEELREAFRLFLKHIDDSHRQRFVLELRKARKKLRIRLP